MKILCAVLRTAAFCFLPSSSPSERVLWGCVLFCFVSPQGVWSVIMPEEAIMFVDREYRHYVQDEVAETDGACLSNRDKRTRRESSLFMCS